MSTIYEGIDYGPLFSLIGTWKSEKGVDVAPDEDGGEKLSEFHETIVFTPVGDLDNAEDQILVGLHYHQAVTRTRDGKKYHNQTGYWMWEPKTGKIMFSIAIPRGMCLLAAGGFTGELGDVTLKVKASNDDPNFKTVESDFMSAKASTEGYEGEFRIVGENLIYNQTTFLDIYGRKFDHTDNSILTRV